MRPISLTMQAFGPYPGRIRIDFDALYQQGIFLVTGETGSGKTMIFDALAFALYGETSSGNQRRHSKSLRSHYAEPNVETFVELVFSHKGERFTIQRSPWQIAMAKRRTKSGNDTVERQAKVTLTRESDGVLLENSDADAQILSLIGLTRVQFTQTVMIAQGDFLQILQASTDTRKELFRKLFRTQIYDRFQEHLKAAYSEASRQSERLGDAVRSAAKTITLPDDDPAYEPLTALQNKPEMLPRAIPPLEKLCGQDRTALSAAQKKSGDAEQAAAHLQEQIKEGERQNQLLRQLQENDAALRKLSAKEPEIAKMQQELDSAVAAAPLFTLYAARASAQKQHQMAADALQQHLALLPGCESAHQQAADVLQSAQQNAEAVDALAREQQAAEDALKLLQECNTARDQHRAAAERAKAARDAGQQAKDALDHAEKQAEAIESYTKQEQDAADALRLLQERSAAQDKYDKAAAQCKAALAAYQAAHDRAESVMRAYVAGISGRLAMQLKDGDACPVCGSRSHPEPAHPTADTPDDKMLDSARKNDETAQRALRDAEQILKQHETVLHDRTDRLKALTGGEIPQEDALKQSAEDAGNAVRRLRDALAAARNYAEAAQKASHEADRTLAEHESVLRDRSGKLAELFGENIPEAKTLEKSAADAQAQIRRLRESLNAASAAEKDAANKLSALQAACKEAENHVQQLRKTEADAAKAYEDARAASIFAEEADFLAARRDPDAQKQLSQAIGAFHRQYSELTSQRDTLRQQCTVTEEVPLDVLRTKLHAETQARADADAQCKRIMLRLNANERALRLLTQLRQEIGTHERDRADLADLYKTVNGHQNQQAKFSFESYVQQFYFRQIISAANHRLRFLTAGLYSLRCREDARSKVSQSGLDLEVYDSSTGRWRDVRTLSGGESFLAALSMALGLSDIVQAQNGGVELDAMFIDEGFGTLDDSTLRQTIRMLGKLADGSRLIGIISHVAALREAIPAQIQVHRENCGSTMHIQI